MSQRPKLFIGSSAEGLDYAKALQVNLDRACEVTIWSQGVFGLSGGTLEQLVEFIQTMDFGVLIVTPDDLIESRGKKSFAARDNVLLELGICIGTLGRERSFLIHDRSTDIKLPSDLAGITIGSFEPHSTNNASASIGAASTLVESSVRLLGIRTKQGNVGLIDEHTQFRIMADLLGVVSTNYIIQMHETGKKLKREQLKSMIVSRYWYGIEFPQRFTGAGRFSLNDLCEKVPDAGISTKICAMMYH